MARKQQTQLLTDAGKHGLRVLADRGIEVTPAQLATALKWKPGDVAECFVCHEQQPLVFDLACDFCLDQLVTGKV